MKQLAKIFMIIMFGAIIAQATNLNKEVKYRDIKVKISSEKQLTTGSNVIYLKIKKSNKLINTDKVSLKAFMPAMPGMPAMSYKTKAEKIEEGKYKANLNFAMGGTWQLHIFITPKNGKKYRVKTTLNF